MKKKNIIILNFKGEKINKKEEDLRVIDIKDQVIYFSVYEEFKKGSTILIKRLIKIRFNVDHIYIYIYIERERERER